jgi:hypothetical protein
VARPEHLRNNVDILQNIVTSGYLFPIHKKGDRIFQDYRSTSPFRSGYKI